MKRKRKEIKMERKATIKTISFLQNRNEKKSKYVKKKSKKIKNKKTYRVVFNIIFMRYKYGEWSSTVQIPDS